MPDRDFDARKTAGNLSGDFFRFCFCTVHQVKLGRATGSQSEGCGTPCATRAKQQDSFTGNFAAQIIMQRTGQSVGIRVEAD